MAYRRKKSRRSFSKRRRGSAGRKRRSTSKLRIGYRM